ncbi:MAG TPA: squalene--hopene cyclase [Bryobacteraceae bacterium]|nr:squalene--hopene cyclase [Bryobacteraceae bacterium]
MSSPSLQIADTLLAASSATLRRAAQFLLSRQTGAGYWSGELTADTTLESDFILLELWRHPPQNGVWDPPTRPQIDKAVRSILARQLPDGGFSIYEKGPSEVSASIKAYVALKLAGLGFDQPDLTRLRERILALGGLQAANSYVKVNLSLFGLYPREHTPSIPPELNLFGNVIYEMSSWTRAIVTPLSILHSMNPRRPVPAGFTVEELFVPGVSLAFADHEKFLSWRNFFFVADRFLKLWERHGSRSLRTRAIRRAEQWMLARTRCSDGLGAIYPSMMYVIMALDVLGYPKDHPDLEEATRQFMNLMIDDHRGFFFQPCFSPVWDTAIAVHVLGESGCVPEGSLTPAADWLLSKEVRRKGDWSIKRPNVEPSGWYFEFANEWYPDIDDTAQVLLALSQSTGSDPEAQKATRRRAIDWLLAMQGSDGGWAAFDVDNNWNFLSCVPFADHNAMLDPTCPDITGRVLEALAACGVPNGHEAVRRGIAFLKRTQESDGSWYGRWGVDYIYGTYLALRGLQASGESDREAYILRAGEWLRSIQNADGGWGESCASYDNGTYTPAHSTPSQTAWAVLGLIAGGDTTSGSVHKGIEHLVETQRSDGGWNEDLSTGTGFPRVFYLQYHLYRHSFPVLALAAYRKARGATHS